MNNLQIIHEDNDIIVCYKPAGVATQTRRLGQQDMVSLLKNYRAKKKEPAYIGVVHRLDQPVEGIMVFAKNEKAAANLSKQVADRSIGKYYYAIGQMSENTDGKFDDLYSEVLSGNGKPIVLTDYMTFDTRTNVGRILPQKPDATQMKKDKNIKKAELEYTVIDVKDKLVCMDIKLHTGRHHQIRLQMAHAGMPLVGDSKYGVAENGQQPALCSYRLEFNHPTSGKALDFEITPHNELFGWCRLG